MNEQQIEAYLQMTMKAIKEIAQEIQHDDPAGESLNSLNRHAVELATTIVLDVQKQKRHAERMELGYDTLRKVDRMVMNIAHRL